MLKPDQPIRLTRWLSVDAVAENEPIRLRGALRWGQAPLDVLALRVLPVQDNPDGLGPHRVFHVALIPWLAILERFTGGTHHLRATTIEGFPGLWLMDMFPSGAIQAAIKETRPAAAATAVPAHVPKPPATFRHPKHGPSISAWRRGYWAAEQGLSVTASPYGESTVGYVMDRHRCWLDGHAAFHATTAKKHAEAVGA